MPAVHESERSFRPPAASSDSPQKMHGRYTSLFLWGDKLLPANAVLHMPAPPLLQGAWSAPYTMWVYRWHKVSIA